MPSNKYWGKVDKAALASLVEDGNINISDTSLEYTASVHSNYFSHHKPLQLPPELPRFFGGF